MKAGCIWQLSWIYVHVASWLVHQQTHDNRLDMEGDDKGLSLKATPKGLVFHSDRGSQYTSKRYQKLLKTYGALSSMGDVGACWDNAVVERFFCSLKHDWIFKIAQPTHEHMKKDVATYMRYYNLERLHTKNGDKSPINYEKALNEVSG